MRAMMMRCGRGRTAIPSLTSVVIGTFSSGGHNTSRISYRKRGSTYLSTCSCYLSLVKILYLDQVKTTATPVYLSLSLAVHTCLLSHTT